MQLWCRLCHGGVHEGDTQHHSLLATEKCTSQGYTCRGSDTACHLRHGQTIARGKPVRLGARWWHANRHGPEAWM
eukprot:1161684-Pelagomonas_calceolata.AAC.5